MNPIAKLIVDKGISLAEAQIPKIVDMAKNAGIDMVTGLLPDTCKPMPELEKLLELRNQLLNQINTVSNSVNSLSKVTNTIQPIVDSTNKAITVSKTAETAALLVLKLWPTGTPVPGQ